MYIIITILVIELKIKTFILDNLFIAVSINGTLRVNYDFDFDSFIKKAIMICKTASNVPFSILSSVSPD